MSNDLITIFLVYLLTLGIQMSIWPVLMKLRKDLVDSGWAAGRLLMTLGAALTVWFASHFKLPINTDWGVFLALLLLVFASIRQLWKMKKSDVSSWFRTFRKMVLVEEGLFLFGFVFLAIVRGFNPEILDLEKFMDWGFVKAYLVSPTLPAKDMWWAGETINYYSFGHFWVSILIRIFGVGEGRGFNLVLAFICGLTLSLGFSVVVNMLGKRKIGKGLILGGVVGSTLMTFGGNSQMWWYIIKNQKLEGYWYPDATRFIYHTIHEFPGYSFVVSDLHGHVLGLPVVLAFLLFLTIWLRKLNLMYSIILGVFGGVMIMTNTWDGLIYGLLVGFLFLAKLRNEWKKLIRMGIVMAVVGIMTSFWWWSGFKSISEGVGLATERTPIWQLVTLWGGHLLFVLGTIFFVRRKRVELLPITMGLTAVVLLILPEIVYVKDIYTTYPRANTMFKLTYQSFIMMSLLGGWLIARLRQSKSLAKFLTGPFLTIWLMLMIYPVPAFSSYYGGLQKYRGLDGKLWLNRDLPEQVMVIDYLEKNRDGKNLVEAVGESYTKYNAISAFSGVPTIVGWKVHEWLWRGGYEAVGARADEVAKIYQLSDMEEVREIIKKYNVGWIVVGENERINYQVNDVFLLMLGEKVFEYGETYILQVR